MFMSYEIVSQLCYHLFAKANETYDNEVSLQNSAARVVAKKEFPS